MKYRTMIITVVAASFLLAACSGQNAPPASSTEPSTPSLPAESQPSPAAAAENVPAQEAETPAFSTQSDSQGAVTVEITPVNLVNPDETLVFDVSMSTHSVDLSMDLAQLAVLSTDTGKTIQAALWDAPRGGHHVEGQLSFSSIVDGANLLEGAKNITITITNVDAPSRVFTWPISG